MAVSYDKALREAAKARGERLATVAIGGVEFQGPVTTAEGVLVMELLTKLFQAHAAAPVEGGTKTG